MIFQIPILVKPYLIKYMAHYCIIEPTYVISPKDRFGSFLINSLRHKNHMPEGCKKYALVDYGEMLMVSIPEHFERNYGLNISIRQMHWFNKFIQEEFQDRMLMFIAPRLNGKKGTIKKELVKFRDRYEINEDDLPLRTLEKMWERNRHKIPCYLMN